MAYKYKHFIPQNTAPSGTKSIGVYKGNGEKVCSIPLGRMSPPNGAKLYSFGLFSDIHVYPIAAVEWTPEVKFDNALTYLESKDCAFCVQCGDFTQTGLYLDGATSIDLRQFAKYKEICDSHTIPVYDLCGNHESIQGEPITNNLAELMQYTGDDLYYSVNHGNDLFILIGQPNYNKVMSDEALQWLYETLEANRNKRCFVFIHPYIEEDSGDPLDFRENSVFVDWSTTKTNAFMNVMRHYKNAILFHGHSHTKFECQQYDMNANYTERNGFKSVHVPSLSKPRDINPETGATPEDNYGSQGYIVDVYDGCIVLNGWDFIEGQYIPLGVYNIDTALQTVEANTFTDSTGTIKT